MSYISPQFFALVAVMLLLYYAIPMKLRYLILLSGSVAFCAFVDPWSVLAILTTGIVAYCGAREIEKVVDSKVKSRILFIINLIIVAHPWVLFKIYDKTGKPDSVPSYVMFIGISFYTLEIISYLYDVSTKKIKAERNLIHFFTFLFYMPKLVQGPISRYEELKEKLIEGHRFDEERFTKGFMKILFGFFLKLVIADKAAVLVNPVFNAPSFYPRQYLILAAVLYSIQLYTDFAGCVMITLGVSDLFGVKLLNNFKRPYLSTSFKEFWKRWHISLSSWLSDYIYKPLGGSRKGKVRRYINLLITFIFSAFWHGIGTGFLVWGLLHALYRILEELTAGWQKNRSASFSFVRRIFVFFLATIGWVFFRCESAQEGYRFFKIMITGFGINDLVLTGLVKRTLGYKEMAVLVLAIIGLIVKEVLNEKGISFKEILIKKPFPVRVIFYLAVILFIMNFGTYGYGYDAASFIYGGF